MMLIGPNPKLPFEPIRVKQFFDVGTPCWQVSGIAEQPVSTQTMISITIKRIAVVSPSMLRRIILVYSFFLARAMVNTDY